MCTLREDASVFDDSSLVISYMNYKDAKNLIRRFIGRITFKKPEKPSLSLKRYKTFIRSREKEFIQEK